MMNREEEALKDFKARLKDFLAAGQRFVTAWEDLDHVVPQALRDAADKGYPFHKDFYEILNDMADWNENVQKLEGRGVLDWRPEP